VVDPFAGSSNAFPYYSLPVLLAKWLATNCYWDDNLVALVDGLGSAGTWYAFDPNRA